MSESERPIAEVVRGFWLLRFGREAEKYLRAQDPRTLGPAGRLLVGYTRNDGDG